MRTAYICSALLQDGKQLTTLPVRCRRVDKFLAVCAGFSGRMPCAELADAIVATGRATLEAAIDFINSHPTWGARVVYGDTDSMFVLLPGRTKESAFRIGGEIADAITAQNPSPIKLKFEKVRSLVH
jgi:DNA polymerase elongation subunit (family B)